MKNRRKWAVENDRSASNGLIITYLVNFLVAIFIYNFFKRTGPRDGDWLKVVRLERTKIGKTTKAF